MDKKPVVLEIDLGLGLQSTDPKDPLSAVRSRNVPRLNAVVAGLRHGAEDDQVVAAVVHIAPNASVWRSRNCGSRCGNSPPAAGR